MKKNSYYSREVIYNYHINHNLLLIIQDILSVKNSDMADALGIAAPNLWRYKKKGDMPMSVLLSICNLYGIRPSAFICIDPVQKFEIQSNTIKHQWFFNSKKMQERIEKEITKTEAQKLLKCGFYNPMIWSQQDAQVSRIIQICNTFRWNIGDFINDRTLEKISPWENETELLLEINRLKLKLNKELELNENAYLYAAESED